MDENMQQAIQLVTTTLAWRVRWNQLGAEQAVPPEYQAYLALLREIDEQGRAVEIIRAMTWLMTTTCFAYASELEEDPQEWWQGIATQLASREEDEPEDA
jgi:hypothetical protein